MKFRDKITLAILIALLTSGGRLISQRSIFIQPAFTYMDARNMAFPPTPGDTLKVLAGRSQTLKFKFLQGTPEKPIVIINSGGQVSISTTAWGALLFENCRYIKVTGSGDKNIHYGFKLHSAGCGLSFSEYSSDCEAEFIEIEGNDDTFFGIHAKKDFGGKPPVPYPQFNNLSIHNNYIHRVTEGIYIGETVSPGMEFRNVSIHNNIIENTGRESLQLANCVEDVEVYNNLFLNSGLDGEPWQNNGFQIGGNTVGCYYNNIVINAPGFGVIIMGMGNIDVRSNYFENTLGAFIDDRYSPIPDSPIILRNNIFRSSTGAEIVKNLNQYNNLYIQDNTFDTNIPVLNKTGAKPPLLVEMGNSRMPVPPIRFELTNGVFKADTQGPAAYALLGPVPPLLPDFSDDPTDLNQSGEADFRDKNNGSDLSSTSFMVYPNPVTDRLIVLPLDNGVTVELISSSGKQVLIGKTGALDTSGLPRGTYFLRITDQNGLLKHQSKIIILH